jgi:rhodanese-related sulfurtransferase
VKPGIRSLAQRPESPAAWLAQIILLVAVSSALALLGNAFNPAGLNWHAPLFKTIDWPELVDQVRQHHAQLVDARSAEDFSQGHVAGAVNIPAAEKSQYLNRIFLELPADGDLVLYCHGKSCQASEELALFLEKNGVAKKRLAIFQPGWEFLRKQNSLPLTGSAKP